MLSETTFMQKILYHLYNMFILFIIITGIMLSAQVIVLSVYVSEWTVKYLQAQIEKVNCPKIPDVTK